MNSNSIAANATRDAAMMSVYKGTKINLAEYRKLSTLPEEAWRYIDERMVTVAKEELNGILDLQARGLTLAFDGMSASVYTKRRSSKVGPATIKMSPSSDGEAGILDIDTQTVPLPVTFKDFLVDTKQMASAARIGLPLDTTLAEEATRSVAITLEDTLFNGTFTAGGATAYGYTTFDQRLTSTITDWAASTDPSIIIAEINTMISLSVQANHFGPWILYIPWEFLAKMNSDYFAGSNATIPVAPSKTVKQRIMDIGNIIDVKVSNALADNNVVMVEMKSNTVQLIEGLPMRTVSWEPDGVKDWEHKFKVLTISVPFLQADYDGNCGIVHGSV